MPSWDLFKKQSAEYRESVLPRAIPKRIAVEMAVGMGWEKWIGDEGEIISIEKFGASAPYKVIMENYGFSVEHVVEIARNILFQQR
jgi:transketolase